MFKYILEWDCILDYPNPFLDCLAFILLLVSYLGSNVFLEIGQMMNLLKPLLLVFHFLEI